MKAGIIVKGASSTKFLKVLFKKGFKMALGELMSAIGFLQLVVFMPLIKVNYPGNARLINDKFIEIATFDIMPTDDIYPELLDFELDEEEPLNDNWDSCDFGTGVFIMNMGSLYLVFLYLIFCFTILGFGKLSCCKNTKCLRKIIDYFSGDLLWNPVLEFIVQSYIEIAFSVILQT